MIDGKQIKTSTIEDSKLASTFIKPDGSVSFTNPVSGVTPSTSGHIATKGYVDSLITGKFPITPCRLATTTNISLTGTQTIDGVVGVNGNRILVKNQSTSSQNGIYIMASGAWSRATDYDATVEVTAGDIIPIQEGATNADTTWELSTDGTITVGSTALDFELFGGLKSTTTNLTNKAMVALVTSADFDQACATTLASAPNRNGFLEVKINGVLVELGNGVKTKDCYFSSNGGTTAKNINALAAGDTLYWVGSVAGFELAVTDKIDFIYSVLN